MLLLFRFAQATTTSVLADSGAAVGPDTWVVVIVSATMGAAIALVGEYVLRRVADYRDFRSLEMLLLQEVVHVNGEAQKRVEPISGLPLRPPLPSEAWRLVVSSRHSIRFKQDLPLIVSLYQEVEDANWKGSTVIALQQVSSLSPDPDVAAAFKEEATRMAAEPYASVAEVSASVLQSAWAKRASVRLRRLNG